jgi:adenosylhomocysteinase
MDLSFADQALSTRYLFETTTLTPGLYDVPPAIDARVAALKLEALGLRLDRLTDAQRAYAGSWQLGTS